MSHWQNGAMWRCMSAWWRFVEDRSSRRAAKASAVSRAVRHWSMGTASRVFGRWCEFVVVVTSERHVRTRTVALACISVLRRYFIRLQAFAVQGRLVRRADQHFAFVSVMRAFTGWARVSTLRVASRSMQWGLAVRHFNVCLLSVTFSDWCAFVTRCRLRKAAVNHAMMHSRLALLRRCMFAWARYMDFIRLSAGKLRLAAQFSHSRVSRRAFDGWRDFTLLSRRQRWLRLRADHHYALVLLLRSFAALQSAAAHSRMLRLVVLRWRRAHMRRALQGFALHLAWRKQSRERVVRAMTHFRSQLASRSIQRWAVAAAALRSQRRTWDLAVKHYSMMLQLRVFGLWREAWIHHKALARAARKWSLAVLARTFTAWRTAVQGGLLRAEPPRITGHPEPIAAADGQAVELGVTVSGSRPLTFQWMRNGVPVAGATASSVVTVLDSAAKVGSYQCVVSNGFGTATSEPAVVSVVQTPVFVIEPKSKVVAHGEEVVLRAEATGAPSYQWLRNGERIPGATGQNLQLIAKPSVCNVRFSCVATNAAGAAVSKEAALADKRLPLEPYVVHSEMWQIDIGWEAPVLAPGAVVDSYCVRVVEVVADGEDHIAEDFVVSGSERSFRFDEFHNNPLVPAEAFRVVVSARVRGADQTKGRWSSPGPVLLASTRPPTGRVALLEGRWPRVFVVKPLTFEQGSDRLKGTDSDLPEVASVLQRMPEMQLSVEGHVNFGQTEGAAVELSRARARAVRVRLMGLGIDRSRLSDFGHGWLRPRYPKGSTLAAKNRRVEMVVRHKAHGPPGGL